MPARPQAWIRVTPFGTSCSLPSMMSLGTLLCLLFWRVDPGDVWRPWRRVTRIVQSFVQERPEPWAVLVKVAGFLKIGRQQIVAMRLELDADRHVPFLARRDLKDLLARVEDGVDIELVFLEQLDAAVDGARLVVELGELQRRVGKLRVVEGKPQRLSPKFIGIGAALGPLVLGDLQMGIDQGGDGGRGHDQRRRASWRCPRARSSPSLRRHRN